MLHRVTCWSGAAAAAQFWVPGRFTRRGALPAPAFTLIQDFGSVMALDGEDHARRKALFLQLLRPEALGRLPALLAGHWLEAARGWMREGEVALFDAAHRPLTRAICEWAGVPLRAGEDERRAREFRDMVEGTGSVGLRHLRGHWQRRRTERWARAAIRAVREGRQQAPPGSALAAIAAHRDRDGALLDEASAGVELINILRPTVANARYAVFIAMALREHPQRRDRLAAEPAWLEPFVQEVRRLSPFIPFIGGIALEGFDWAGQRYRPRPPRLRGAGGLPAGAVPRGGCNGPAGLRAVRRRRACAHASLPGRMGDGGGDGGDGPAAGRAGAMGGPAPGSLDGSGADAGAAAQPLPAAGDRGGGVAPPALTPPRLPRHPAWRRWRGPRRRCARRPAPAPSTRRAGAAPSRGFPCTCRSR